MPVESNVELGEGRLYIDGIEGSLEIRECEATYELDAPDDYQYINIPKVNEEFTFTCESTIFNRDWTLVSCSKCGYEFPVTKYYTLIYGRNMWLCPRCNLNRRLKSMEWCKRSIQDM